MSDRRESSEESVEGSQVKLEVDELGVEVVEEEVVCTGEYYLAVACEVCVVEDETVVAVGEVDWKAVCEVCCRDGVIAFFRSCAYYVIAEILWRYYCVVM